MKNREPIVAGRFYSDNKSELIADLEQFFLTCKPSLNFKKLRALIAPHAGYVFSGEVAASAYNQIPENASYKRVFVIGSSHCTWGAGASIYNEGHYITPLGKVKVDIELANQLIEGNEVFNFYPDAHRNEHSLEVQLPFLQYKLGDSFKLVPIVLVTNKPEEISLIVEALAPYYNSENLFVISSDFSHYPNYEDAQKVDKLTAEAIVKNNPDLFLQKIKENKNLGISNLSTSVCGWTSVLTLLYLSSGNKHLKFHLVQYKNSGDAKFYADRNRVVGYHAIVVNDNEEDDFTLSKTDKQYLLMLARERLSKYLRRQSYFFPDEQIPELVKTKTGVFVSIYKGKELRGCIGRFADNQELFRLVEDLAVSAANDYRFDPVTEDDLPELNIEISVLTPLKRISGIDELELGRHGIYIRQGDQSGTFLPQVAEKTNWTKEEFISRCSRDKARIGSDGWKTAELFTYEAIVFNEQDFRQE